MCFVQNALKEEICVLCAALPKINPTPPHYEYHSSPKPSTEDSGAVYESAALTLHIWLVIRSLEDFIC
jgi:hypothetical protein